MRRAQWLTLGAALVLTAGCEGTGPADPVVASVVISPTAHTLVALQDTALLSVEVRDRSGALLPDAPVEWSTPDSLVARVDARGRVVSRADGTARIVAASGGLADTAEVTVSAAATGTLSLVRLAGSAPPLATRDAGFWAVRGEDRRLEIRFRGEPPGEEGDRFLELRVRDGALLRYPDGRAFQGRDSVWIRVRIDEGGLFLFDMEPSGLRFDPERPAELRIRYRHARQEDLDREESVHLWRRADPASPWTRIATARLRDVRELRAEITGFSSFSLAIP
jgi:hypothetical protein